MCSIRSTEGITITKSVTNPTCRDRFYKRVSAIGLSSPSGRLHSKAISRSVSGFGITLRVLLCGSLRASTTAGEHTDAGDECGSDDAEDRVNCS